MTKLDVEKKPDIWVGSEWGRLKEVIIGRADQLRFPVMNEMFKSRLQIYDAAERENFFKYSGKLFSEAFPERFAKVIEETENWVRLLESRGIKVYRTRLLDEDESRYMADYMDGNGAFFVKDPLSVVGNVVIEGGNRVPYRHKDVFAYRDILKERVLGSNAKWINMPRTVPDTQDPNGGPGPFLTGGDIFPMGNNNVLLGYNGVDSDLFGLQWLASILRAEGWKVHFIEYSPEVMHLDTAMSCPREGVALVCKEALPNGLPDLIKGWEIVECTLEEAKIDATNGLPLGAGVYAMSEEFQHLGDKLEKKGIEVIYSDMRETNRTTGGGMRCSHGALVRED